MNKLFSSMAFLQSSPKPFLSYLLWGASLSDRIKSGIVRASLMIQWLRLHLPRQGVWVWSLVGEQRSHMPRGQKPKRETSNIVTNSIKTSKMVTSKKKTLPQKWSRSKCMPLPGSAQPAGTCNLSRCTGQHLSSAQSLHTDTHALCTRMYTHTPQSS